MFLANHISWADIYALNSIIPLQFIAKSDINNWPVLGYLVRKSGTIFIDRSSRKDTARIVETTVNSLVAGSNVGFFPKAQQQMAQSWLALKVALYKPPLTPTPHSILSPYATRSRMAASTRPWHTLEKPQWVMNVLKQKTPMVELHFLTPISPKAGNRQALTQAVFKSISAQLKL